MIGFLRFVGIVNAAVWLGAAVFFSIGILPGIFSQEMAILFNPNNPDISKYYQGGAAQILFKSYFTLQNWCGSIALLHLLAECFYMGRTVDRLTLGVLLTIFSCNLFAGIWLQPRLNEWHRTRYWSQKAELREEATRSFKIWHGISQAANLCFMAGLLFYLWQVTRLNHPSSNIRKLSMGWK